MRVVLMDDDSPMSEIFCFPDEPRKIPLSYGAVKECPVCKHPIPAMDRRVKDGKVKFFIVCENPDCKFEAGDCPNGTDAKRVWNMVSKMTGT